VASLIGKEIGKYRITERIGRGGMAEVYEGIHTHLDRKVAVKVLHSHLLEGGDFVARFKREAKAVANLLHPNIVQVYDFDIQDDLIFMVMQYIDGMNLHAKLVEAGKLGERLPIKQIASIISDIASALDYAHSRDMLHRDIKPSNIMIDQDNKAYLTDFGIAKLFDEKKFTATGQIIGTPAYMSPEQARGEKLTEESDIYSLGVVSFEMLTGQVPYDAETPIGIALKQINDPVPTMSELVDDIPGTAQGVIDKALSKVPDSRYSSAEELVGALKIAMQALEALESVPISIPEDPPTVVDDGLDAPTVTMDADELEQPTVVMKEDKPVEKKKPEKKAKPKPDLKSPREKKKIPLWTYIAGGATLLLLVSAVLSQALGFSLSDLTTNISQEEVPEVTETQKDIATATPSTLDLLNQKTEVCDTDNHQECIDLNYALIDAGIITANGYHEIAVAYINLGEFGAALEPVDQAIELDPGHTDAIYTRGSIMEELGDPESALGDFSTLLNMGYKTSDIYNRIGWAYYQLGEIDAAQEAFDQAIDLDPEASWVYHNRGYVKHEIGDLEGALADYLRALEIDPEYSPSIQEIGRIHYDKGLIDEALSYFEQALELDPDNPWSRIWRAIIRWEAFSDTEGALEDLEIVINSQSEIIPWAYDNRANIYQDTGQYELCISNYDEVVAAYPDYPWTYNTRGYCYEKLGDFQAAREDYERFLELTAGDPELAENRYWIQKSLENLNK